MITYIELDIQYVHPQITRKFSSEKPWINIKNKKSIP